MKKQGCLVTVLKILGVIILIPILIVFGWIAGAIWLLFFRKKLNDNPEKQKKTTIIVSILSAISLIIMIFSFATYKPLKSIEISSDANGQELEIDQDYIIDITYEPENATNPTFTYNIDNFCATFEKSGDDNRKAILHTKSEGTVTISVSSDTINSNSLEFTIVDNTEDTDALHNFLMDYELTVEDVLNGSGDNAIGKCAFIRITDEELEKITPDMLKEFAENVVDNSDYNWISIITPSYTGICFSGSDTAYATYGKLDKDGSILETIGMWTLDTNGNYTYSETEETAEPSPEEPPKTINGDIDINFSKSVRNDVTGNWRLTRVATTKQIQEYALEYCNSYFQSDDEIHAIINFTLNTTNKLAKVTPDILDVSVYDYVDKEEHDAKALFSGTPLAHYEISIPTGDITEIPLEGTEPLEETNPADASTTAEPVSETEPENPPETAENTEMVWLSATGEKYHSIPNCGRMDPNKARQVSKADAEASGYAPCTKCY